MTTYKIIEDPTGDVDAYQPYGGALELWKCKDPEVVIAGPAETGKTLGALHRLDAMCWKYPGAQMAIVRKIYRDMPGSVLQTFQRDVLMPNSPVEIYGGRKPERFIYPNGSVIWIGGMDNPGKVLSSERDVIYANQAEELKLEDWETMLTRCTGRADNMPYAQLIGDANPGPPKHFIREREKAGHLTFIVSRHEDNPTLYDPETGEITERGIRTMRSLDSLTGVRYQRLRLGNWVQAEGTVYDTFSRDAHVKTRDIKEFQRIGFALDEGYTNPAVILAIGEDGDGRLHIFEEFYQTGVLQRKIAATVKQWSEKYADPWRGASDAIVDGSAAGLIADLVDVGLSAKGSKGRVLDGITLVQGLLAVPKDGYPRLTIDPSCVNTINEFESYIWKEGKDEPVKDNDHAMDALRYFCIWRYGGVKSEAQIGRSGIGDYRG